MRLTKKGKNGYFMICDIDALDGKPNVKEHANKLGQLEDIMEKYGINSAEELEHIILNDATGEQSFKDYIKPYKDIEEGLGVELLIREKALQNGAWYKSNSRGIVFCPFVRIVGKGKALELKEEQRSPVLCAKTCDCGKTWALTREELE